MAEQTIALRGMVAADAAAIAALIRAAFAACGFLETTRGAHPGYAKPTFVNMKKWLAH